MTEESTPDYARDPTRWGSAEIAALFPGFQHLDMRTSGAVIRLRHGGSGPPLLLLHGNPQNHVAWHKVAGRLAAHYHVVLPDLRGYGDSSLPEAGPDHINYSFRAMAQDMVEIMEALGYRRYFLAGHDRGGRAAYRMCLDHEERVIKVALLDILPNYHVWTNINKNGAIASWHWYFMAQPEPFPERLISAVPAEYFLRSRMLIRGGTGLGFLTQSVLDEYVRCYTLKTITGSCRDYRASPTSDFANGLGRQGPANRHAGAAPLGRPRADGGAHPRVCRGVAKIHASGDRYGRHAVRSLYCRRDARSCLSALHRVLPGLAPGEPARRQPGDTSAGHKLLDA
jgi:haloacetate dehalogenase